VFEKAEMIFDNLQKGIVDSTLSIAALLVGLAPVALVVFVALAPVALVVFVGVAPCANAPLILLRMFGIPNAPNPKNKEPPPINFMKSLLEKFADMIQYNLV
jgi:hypothetical protein